MSGKLQASAFHDFFKKCPHETSINFFQKLGVCATILRLLLSPFGQLQPLVFARFNKNEMAKSYRQAIYIPILFLTMLMQFPVSLLAQACCTGGTPMLSNLGLAASKKYQLEVLLSEDINVLKDLMSGSDKLNNRGNSRFTYSTLLEANYGISGRFAISGLFSYIVQRRKIVSLNGMVHENTTHGLGDMAFLLKYNLLKADGPASLLLGAGPKLPTGRADLSQDGILLPADLQPGSGALDLLVWGYFSKTRLIRDHGTFTLIATYRHTGTNSSYGFGNQADKGYRFGNEFLATASIGEQFLLKKQILDLILTFQYRQVGVDHTGGNVTPATGGKWLNLVPGIAWYFNPKLALRLSATLPLYRNLVDVQLTTSYKVTAGIYFKLDFSPKKTISY